VEVSSSHAKKASGDFNADGPTKIRSKKIDIKRNKQEVRFFEDVIVENGDSSMLSQEMVLIYDEKKGDNKETTIKRIDAIGDVKIFTEEFIATSKSGYYIPSKEQFILEEDVIVNNGTSIASGSRFVYNLLTKKGRFIGEKNESRITGKGGVDTDGRVIVIIGEGGSNNKKE
jgi:lipopolysaccharide transport protein LptA